MLPALLQSLMVALNIAVATIVTATTTTVPVNALPITSNPIEGTAENLAWQAWIMMSPHQQNLEKSRKVTPKSIFLLPNRVQIPAPGLPPDAQQWAVDPGSGGGGLYAAIECPPGQRQYETRCISTLDIDRDMLLLQELQTLLLQQQDGLGNGDNYNNNNNNNYDYDYNYEDAVGDAKSTESINGPAPLTVRSSSQQTPAAAPSVRDHAADVVHLPNDDAPLKFNIFKANFPTIPESGAQNQTHTLEPKSITNSSAATPDEISGMKHGTDSQSAAEGQQQHEQPLSNAGDNNATSSNNFAMSNIDAIVLPAASTYDHQHQVSFLGNESGIRFIATSSNRHAEESDAATNDAATMKWMALNITELLRLDSLLPVRGVSQATIETKTATATAATTTKTTNITSAATLSSKSTSTSAAPTTLSEAAVTATTTKGAAPATTTLPQSVTNTATATPTLTTTFLTTAEREQSDLPIEKTTTRTESVRPNEKSESSKKPIQEEVTEEEKEDKEANSSDSPDQTDTTDPKTTDTKISSTAPFHTPSQSPLSASETTVHSLRLDETTNNNERDQQRAAAASIQGPHSAGPVKGQEQESKVKPAEKQTNRKHNGSDHHGLAAAIYPQTTLRQRSAQQEQTVTDANYVGHHDDQFRQQSSAHMKSSNGESEFDERRRVETALQQQQPENTATATATATATGTTAIEAASATETTSSEADMVTELRAINEYVKSRREEALKGKMEKTLSTTTTATTTTITAQDRNKQATTATLRTATLPPSPVAAKQTPAGKYDEPGAFATDAATATASTATVFTTTTTTGTETTKPCTGTPEKTTTKTDKIGKRIEKNQPSAINLRASAKKTTTATATATTTTTSAAKKITNKAKLDKTQFMKTTTTAAAAAAAAAVTNTTDLTIPRTTTTTTTTLPTSLPATHSTAELQPSTTTTTTTTARATDLNSSLYWWLPIDWRLDRPTDTTSSSSSSSINNSDNNSSINPTQNQTKSLLLRFWSAFPGHQSKVKE